VTSVPHPHGADAGEESLRQEVLQNPDAVDYVILMDAAGRRSIRRAVDDQDEAIRVVAPPFLFYILYDNDLISRREFCEACGELLEREGWTGYNAVKAAWDGIPDYWEQVGVPLANTTRTVELDPNDQDVDGDNLEDGSEINMSDFQQAVIADDRVFIRFPGFGWRSDPIVSDTDDDGTPDGPEVTGTDIPIVEDSSGDPYMWAEATSMPANGTLNGTSDPRDPYTDDDGLNDTEERILTRTDPNATQTYSITADHEQMLRDAFRGTQSMAEVRLKRSMGLRSGDLPSQDDVEQPDFTDATDAFDFVTVESATGLDQFNFTALDGTNRTDYWLRNIDEIRVSGDGESPGYGYRPGRNFELDPWDPDTDDELTDGQERTPWEYGTQAHYLTDPTDPDTDDDGYWDGWIGVYDVNYSDDVVLYREHLQSGTGVTGDETVDEQVEVHDVSDSAVEGNATGYHSKLHVGELQWGTDPTDGSGSETPDPTVGLEIGYHWDNTEDLRGMTWRESIQNNYALYGITVEIEEADDSDLLEEDDLCVGPIIDGNCLLEDHRQPFNFGDLAWIAQEHSETDALYLFVGNVTNDPEYNFLYTTQSGARLYMDNRDDTISVNVFSWGLSSGPVPQQRLQLSSDEVTRAVGLKTAVHEIGHVLNIGKAELSEPGIDALR